MTATLPEQRGAEDVADHGGAEEPPAPRAIITEPGLYDITEDDYHADPVPGGSLSSTGARKLLPPSCPALFRHEQLNGGKDTAAFDYGKAAHRVVLGTGPEIEEIKAPDWKKPANRELAAQARAAGKVPILTKDLVKIRAMAAALTAHPTARHVFTAGAAEQSAFWIDGPAGVWRRARFDWLPHPTQKRLIIRDYKTIHTASPDAIEKAINEHGYYQQDPWYRDAVVAMDLDDDPAFIFTFQEKDPPYLVTVVELDAEAVQIGRARNRRALELYAECRAHDTWPGYADEHDVHLIGLPTWAAGRYRQELSA